MEPKFEPKQRTPEEIAQLEKSRTISDAGLLNGGAEYVVNEKGEKELRITEDQIIQIRKEFENLDDRRAETIFKKLAPLNEALDGTGMAISLRGGKTVQGILFYRGVGFHDNEYEIAFNDQNDLDVNTLRVSSDPSTRQSIPLKDISNIFFIDHRISVSFDKEGNEAKK